jgi:site-specific DNA-cytosine methylase
MKILGVVDGIGSMMVGARDDHEIIGNIEWRKYYHTGTFEHNFPGSFMVKGWDELSEDQIKKALSADMVIGHPECGNFSILNTKGFKETESLDLPYFIDVVNRVKPKFFLADNLPKSLLCFSLMDWTRETENYKVYPLWVSNFGYGNAQKFRNRLFIFGVRNDIDFEFVPNEKEHNMVTEDFLEGLPTDSDIIELNHVHKKYDSFLTGFNKYCFGNFEDRGKGRITWGEFKDNIILDGRTICVYNKQGDLKKRPGHNVRGRDQVAPTLTGGGWGGSDGVYDSKTYQPFTIRERARIQGFPDSFIFLPINYYEDQNSYDNLIKQTGKCMPIQFCTYIVEQIGLFVDHGLSPDPEDAKTILKPNPIIENQKALMDLY